MKKRQYLDGVMTWFLVMNADRMILGVFGYYCHDMAIDLVNRIWRETGIVPSLEYATLNYRPHVGEVYSEPGSTVAKVAS